MFGYITIDRGELKGKDYDKYRAYYCGVCQDLKASCGQAARATLTYDCTFLAILLTGLYEEGLDRSETRCILHPGRKLPVIRNKFTAYAADMNLLLVRQNLLDDWLDDRNLRSLAAAKALEKPYRRTAARYPRQNAAIEEYLVKLHEAEKRGERSLDYCSGLTGELMAEIFAYTEDMWQKDLRRIGFWLGKFIYLMDAWDDVEKDKKSGNYNPFVFLPESGHFDDEAGAVLTMMASEAARAFERLPILENVDILRNILYSGIWTNYRKKRAEKAGKAAEAASDSPAAEPEKKQE
ncbi:MAG: DUF5685 family protein [Eubacterium sp.]|nr:DUF5685 family protein [Eubacterium sp.]